MTKREKLLALIRAKLRNGDERGAMRICIENKILSTNTYLEERRKFIESQAA